MTVTINSIRADFHLDPPVITFLQGALMEVPNIRDTIRDIEETEEGRSQPFPNIVDASGNVDFSENVDGSSVSALTIRVLAPYVCAFEPGPIPFNSTLGNILFTSVPSPGAMVKINNAVGAMLVSTGGAIPTPAQNAAAVWAQILAGGDSAEVALLAAAASQGLTPAEALMLTKIYSVFGLDPTKPLVETPTSRKVPADGSLIDQTFTVVGTTVTVQQS